MLRNEPLPCLDLEEALVAFMDWLGEVNHFYSDFYFVQLIWIFKVDGSVVLVAHGCFRQQGKVLLRNLEEFQIPYDEVISGFTDSFVASEKLVPSAECHSLEGMLRQLGLAWDEVDDAVEKAHDVRRVCQVSKNKKCTKGSFQK